jgi:hypothetical protein
MSGLLDLLTQKTDPESIQGLLAETQSRAQPAGPDRSLKGKLSPIFDNLWEGELFGKDTVTGQTLQGAQDFGKEFSGDLWRNTKELAADPIGAAVNGIESLTDDQFLPSLGANASNFISDPIAQTTNAMEAGANMLPTASTPEELQQILTEVAGADISDADKEKVTDDIAEKSSETISIATRDLLKSEGATPEELNGWDKFSEDFDVATIGMALLASNDGSQPMMANLGKALMMGKQAKTDQKDKAIGSASAARKEALENRKVAATERTADAALIRASAEMAKSGKRSIVDNAAAIKASTAYLTQAGVNKDAAGGKAQQFATDVAELHSRGNLSMAEAQERMLQVYKDANIFTKTGWFTGGDWE